jgi:hypothetical protein
MKIFIKITFLLLISLCNINITAYSKQFFNTFNKIKNEILTIFNKKSLPNNQNPQIKNYIPHKFLENISYIDKNKKNYPNLSYNLKK